ncbi:9795_t:CDS:2, partial [Scutellospora calospora]
MTHIRPNRLIRNNSNSENNIRGNDLESKLEKLQNIIDEAKEQKERIKRYQNTQIIVSSIINQRNQEKEEFKQKINKLKNKNKELRRQILMLNNDLYYERILNERIIANQQTQIDNLETRRLRRMNAFFITNNISVHISTLGRPLGLDFLLLYYIFEN